MNAAEAHVQRGRSHARIAVLAQAALLAVALVVPASASAATVGFNLLTPSVSTVAYSDMVVFRGNYTCINDAAGNCPTGVSSQTATFALRLAGGSVFNTVATVTTNLSFTSSASGCPTTCTVPFQVTWRAGRVGTTTVPPGVYDLRLTTTIAAGEPIILNALTIVPEGTTTTYGGALSGLGGDPLALSASVVDLDRGLSPGTGIITPDVNLAGPGLVIFALYDSTNTTLVVGPVSAPLLASGATNGSPSLTLPTGGGSFRLRTTFLGNGFYLTSADLDTITVTPSNTPPQLLVPTGPIVAEATSPAGAVVGFDVSATDLEDEPDPTPVCSHDPGPFPLGDTAVTCSVTDSGGLGDSDAFVVSVVDTTDPAVWISTGEAVGATGWYNLASNDDVAGLTVDVVTADLVGPVTLACTDNGAPLGALAAGGDSFVLGDGQHAIECTVADAAGNEATASASFDVDQTAPTIGATVSPSAADTGWWNAATGAPTVTFTCADTTSGVVSCTDPVLVGEGADQQTTGTAVDAAGNTSDATASNLDVDLGAPTTVTFDGTDLVDGASYYFAFVPVAPTGCSATDDVSGVSSCEVTGYSALVGSHELVAAVEDAAGNQAAASLGYDVLAWTLVGFAQPIDMTAENEVKGRGPVQLKFEVFAGTMELSSPDVVVGLEEQRINCTTEASIGSPRGKPARVPGSDTSGGHFSLRWEPPDLPGTCWLVTVRTADGSSLSAAFRLR